MLTNEFNKVDAAITEVRRQIILLEGESETMAVNDTIKVAMSGTNKLQTIVDRRQDMQAEISQNLEEMKSVTSGIFKPDAVEAPAGDSDFSMALAAFQRQSDVRQAAAAAPVSIPAKDNEAQPEPEAYAEPEVQPEPETYTEPEAQPEPEAYTEPENSDNRMPEEDYYSQFN